MEEREAAEQFGIGFYLGTGSDTSARTFIAMGTSNYGSWASNSTNMDNHGIAWAKMVSDGEAYFSNNGYAGQVQMRGAIDAEMDWNAPAPTESWAQGYDSAGTTYYWDFGDAAGCPPIGSACDNTWGQRGVWLMSYGYTYAEPLPEIYNNGQGEEWGSITNFAFVHESTNMVYLGPVSQHQACADQGMPCSGSDNTPDQAWDDLYNNLNCSSCDVPQTPAHVTNIRWTLTEAM